MRNLFLGLCLGVVFGVGLATLSLAPAQERGPWTPWRDGEYTSSLSAETDVYLEQQRRLQPTWAVPGTKTPCP